MRLTGGRDGHDDVIHELAQPDSQTVARIQEFLEECEAESSKYDEGFPAGFEEYLFIYDNYMSDEILKALLAAAGSVGDSEVLFIAKELLQPDEEPQEESHRLVGVDQFEALTAYRDHGSEFYLAALDFRWIAWAYHEPCLHIGGDAAFISAFKASYPRWEAECSPWYEPGGIPVCHECGNWWRPGWGDWKVAEWSCPECRGEPVPPWKGTDNRTLTMEQLLEAIREHKESEGE